ncbi:hypothetical protein Lfu02_40720 [Longispora fulva]|uniref:Transcriptional regulator n=1 Tax=Longispora fulva TaxID=619741 RepID=A0A8J7KFR5_9ACTN|nr:transcriptional regulator [Longispora fulva]MBG6136530.1 hypothetical protein [Longispora fulva]GIG59700.1 hypothetical protein Lfu02_40720 [Longispora fulva]
MTRRLLSSPDALRHPLSYVRHERGWTLQDLVDVIAWRVGNMAARREKAWKWENWGVVPDVETQLALARELGVQPELVQALGWPSWLPVGDQITQDTPWSADGAFAQLDATAGSAMVDRRGFLIMGTGIATRLADDWLNIDSQQLVSVLRGGRVDAGLVACFEQRLPQLRKIEAAIGGGNIRSVVDTELRLVTDLIAHGSYTADIAQRLFTVAGELGCVAGWTSFDAGWHAAAERYWVAALHAAHTAGDRGLGANVLKCMSLQRVDAERPTEALGIARAGLEGARNAQGPVVAMLAVRQARTHAMLGDASECEQLLLLASQAMERPENRPTPHWAAYFDRSEYCAQVAACYQQLGRHQTTNEWLTQALAQQPEDRNRDRATYLIWHADAVLNLGDVEHACALVSQAVPDIAVARSARNQKRLNDIHAKIKIHRNVPAVDLLTQQVRELAAA